MVRRKCFSLKQPSTSRASKQILEGSAKGWLRGTFPLDPVLLRLHCPRFCVSSGPAAHQPLVFSPGRAEQYSSAPALEKDRTQEGEEEPRRGSRFEFTGGDSPVATAPPCKTTEADTHVQTQGRLTRCAPAGNWTSVCSGHRNGNSLYLTRSGYERGKKHQKQCKRFSPVPGTHRWLINGRFGFFILVIIRSILWLLLLLVVL